MNISSLSDLLSLRLDQLALDHATISLQPGAAVITGSTTALGVAATLTVTLTAANNTLVPAASLNLPELSLAGMARLGWLPPSIYGPDDLPAASFAQSQIIADPPNRQVRIIASAPSAPLSIGGWSLSGQTLELLLYVPATGNPTNLSAEIRGTLQLGAGLPVVLTLPREMSGWILQSASGATVSLGGAAGSALAQIVGGPLGGLLPANLGLPGDVSALSATFAANPPALQSNALTLSTTAPWTIVAGALVVQSVSVRFDLQYAGGTPNVPPVTVVGTIRGTLTLLSVDVTVEIPLPPSGPWTVTAYPFLQVPGIGGLLSGAANLLGAGDISGRLPPGLDTLGSLSLDLVQVAFDPVARQLLSVSFGLTSETGWTIPYVNSLAITGIEIDFTVENPADAAARAVVGSLSGTVLIGDTGIPVLIERTEPGGDWMLGLNAERIAVGLADLVQLAGISAAEFTAALPSGLSFLADLQLTGLATTCNLTAATVSSAAIEVTLTAPWDPSPHIFTINTLTINLGFTSLPASGGEPASRDFSAFIASDFTFAGANFEFYASKASSDTAWLLNATMLGGETMDLVGGVVAGLNALLPGGITLPASFPQVTLTAAELQVTPATGKFHSFLESQVSWNLPFAARTLEIKNLQVTLDVDPPAAGGTRPYRFTAQGGLQIGSALHCQISFTTSSAADPTLLRATLAADEVASLSLAGVADSFTAANTWAQLPRPTGYSPPTLSGASLYLNATDKVLILHGQAVGYGMAALLVKQFPPAPGGTASQWGFAFAFALAPGAKLGDLFAPLAVVDRVLSFQQASLALMSVPSQLPAGTNPSLFSELTRVDDVPAVANAQSGGSGLNFYARLTLTAPLLQNLGFIVSGLDTATVTLFAQIGSDPASAVFRASLAGFRLVQFVAVDELTLEYRPQATTAGSQLDLLCRGAVELPAKDANGGDQQVLFSFAGHLTVTSTRATFVADAGSSTTGVARSPLGIPGITFNGLRLAIVGTFDPPPKRVDCAIEADVVIGSVQGLTGRILFVAGAPVVAAVEFGPPDPNGRVPMKDLFAQSIGTQNWNSPLLPEVKFLSGRVYYAKAAVAFGTTNYQQGFWVDTAFSIFGRDFTLVGGLTPGNGLSATGTCVASVNLGFATLTGPAGTGGPGVKLDATNELKKLELLFGLEIFGLTFTDGSLAYSKPAGGTAVYSGSITYPHPILGLGSSFTLSATWSQTDGFRITSWPLAPVVQAIDWIKHFAEVGSGDPCKALGDLGITNDLVQSGFTANTQMANTPPSATPPPRATIDVLVTIGYTISIKLPGQNPKQIISTSLPAFTVSFEVPHTMAEFAANIALAVVNAVPRMVSAILSDPAALAALSGALILARISNQALSSLICRGVSSDAIKAEARSRGGQQSESADTKTEKAEQNAASAEGAATAEAAAAFASTAETFAVAAISVFASIIGWFKKLFGSESDEEKEAKRKKARAEAAQQRAINAVKAKLQIQGLQVVYVRRGRISVTWNAVAGPGVIYSVGVNCAGAHVFPLDQTQNSLVLDDAAFTSGKQISISVTGKIARPNSFGPFQDYYVGDPATQTLNVPDFGPAGLVAEQVGRTLVARWKAGPQAADSFSIQVSQTGGIAVPAPAVTAVGSLFVAVIPEAQLRVDATYTVSVTAQKPNNPTEPVTAAPIVFVALAAPQQTHAGHLSGTHQIAVSWSGPAAAASFAVQVYTDITSPVEQRTAVANTSSLAIDNPAFAPPASYTVRVGACTAANAQTVWGDPVGVTIADLAQPVTGSLAYGAAGLEARWPAVAGALGYEVSLASEPHGLATQPTASILLAPPPGQQPDPARPYPLALFPGAVFSAGDTLKFSVRATAAGSFSVWSAITPASTTVLPAIAPVSVRVEQVGTELVLRWQPGAGGRRPYEVRLHDGADRPLATPPTILIDQEAGTARLSGAALAAGSTYLAAVHAIDAALSSDWVVCPPIVFTALSAPSDLEVTGMPGAAPGSTTVIFALEITATVPAAAADYKLELAAADGTAIVPATSTRTPVQASQVVFSVADPRFVRGTALQVRVGAQTAQAAQTVWSEWLAFTPASIPAPQNLVLVQPSSGVIASWDRALAGDHYRVTAQVGTAPVAVLRNVTTTQVTVAAAPLPAGTTEYRVRVRAQRDGFLGPEATAGPSPTVVPALAVTASYLCGEQRVQATWSAIAPAALAPDAVYEVQVLQNQVLQGQLASTTGNTAQVAPTAAQFAAGPGYLAQVRQRLGNASLDWATSAGFNVHLAVPAPASPSVTAPDAGTLRVAWAAVTVGGAAGAALYAVRITRDGQPFASADNLTGLSFAPTLTPAQLPLEAHTFVATVRASIDGSVGDWATSPPLTVVTLTPDALAQQLKQAGMSGQQAAARIATRFPQQSPADLAALLLRVFPETVGTALLFTWALANARVDQLAAAPLVRQSLPATNAIELAIALTTAYPAPDVLQRVDTLVAAGKAGAEAVTDLTGAFPSLTATQAGYLLLSRFPAATPPESSLATALKVRFPMPQTSEALRNLFPLLSAVQLAVILRSVFQL